MTTSTLRSGKLLLAVLAVSATTGCNWAKPKGPDMEERSVARRLADARRLKQACGSAQTYDRLKALTFDQAGSLRSVRSPLLDRIEAGSTVRMERPVAKSRDEQLDITVCAGHLILDLPPGTESAFHGQRRLDADIEYSAQAAADGSGLVYQMKGAEPIVFGLASLTLPRENGQSSEPPAPTPVPPSGDTSADQPAPSPAPAPQERPAMPPAPVKSRAAPTPVFPRPEKERPAEATPMRDRTGMIARPSFDCGRVTSRVLRLVCSDPALAARDRRMSSAFYAALAAGDDETRATLRASRDRFLSSRGRCSTANCIAQAYDQRMAEIRDIARGR